MPCIWRFLTIRHAARLGDARTALVASVCSRWMKCQGWVDEGTENLHTHTHTITTITTITIILLIIITTITIINTLTIISIIIDTTFALRSGFGASRPCALRLDRTLGSASAKPCLSQRLEDGS